ncbi:MAG TPA: hypothetical protein PLO78_06660 [Candidatus Omnitrophota bacterium]|nr:hypothetical protein [Candidatus Omnitrophota bacterium]
MVGNTFLLNEGPKSEALNSGHETGGALGTVLVARTVPDERQDTGTPTRGARNPERGAGNETRGAGRNGEHADTPAHGTKAVGVDLENEEG